VSGSGGWRPCATPRLLHLRARLLADVRRFFAARGVLEVDTPVLSRAGNPDPHIDALATRCTLAGATRRRTLWLNTSPEFAMKRLLAAGSGPIYQLAHAFRDGERGRRHNPEFTLLEWYRPGMDHHALMDEVADLLAAVAGWPAPRRVSFRQAFSEATGLDPFTAADAALAARAGECAGTDPGPQPRAVLLDLLLSHAVAPALHGLVFVYDFPAAQAALARVRPGAPPVAERFELFAAGMELANGFNELTDAREQGDRFTAQRAGRRAAGRRVPALDRHLLGALRAGLPACAGVALGIDRLLMRMAGCEDIAEVLAFPVERA